MSPVSEGGLHVTRGFKQVFYFAATILEHPNSGTKAGRKDHII